MVSASCSDAEPERSMAAASSSTSRKAVTHTTWLIWLPVRTVPSISTEMKSSSMSVIRSPTSRTSSTICSMSATGAPRSTPTRSCSRYPASVAIVRRATVSSRYPAPSVSSSSR